MASLYDQRNKKTQPSILSLEIKEEQITANISDSRVVSIPTAWFPRLLNASFDDLNDFQISPSGYGIHWPKIDEDISIKAFIG